MKAPVVIVGAGPGGLTLGLLLARAGIAVRVCEQAASFAREFRGDGLLPGGLRILEAIGLRERLRSLERTSPSSLRLTLCNPHKTYESPPLRLRNGQPLVTAIPQRQLLDALAEEADGHPAFELNLGLAIREVVLENGRAVGVRHADGFMPASLVVGFDGRFSTIRRTAGIELDCARVGFDVVWCSVVRPAACEERYEAVVSGDDVCFWYPSGTTMRVGWLVRKGALPRLRAEGFERFRGRVLAATSEPLRSALAPALRDWDDVTFLPAVSEIATRWWLPGVLLLGDAAHPMSPVGAQGINVALEDAYVAASYLIEAFATALSMRDGRMNSAAPSLDAALAAIEARRRPWVARIARAQNVLPRLMLAIGPERALRLAIAWLVPLATTAPVQALAQRVIRRYVWGDPRTRVQDGHEESTRTEERPHRQTEQVGEGETLVAKRHRP